MATSTVTGTGEPPLQNFDHPTTDRHDKSCEIKCGNKRPPEGPKRTPQLSLLKHVNFCIGVTLSLCGVGAFLITATSRKWVEVEVEVDTSNENYWDIGDTKLGHRHRTLAHMGPWVACNNDGRCDNLWLLAPGLEEQSVRSVQTMLLLALSTYLAGAMVIVMQLLRPRGLLDLKLCKCLLNSAIAECLLPAGAVMAILFLLMMGELKRKLILQSNQITSPGWSFVVCLISVLATVTGSVCMIFNRQKHGWVSSSCSALFGPWFTERMGDFFNMRRTTENRSDTQVAVIDSGNVSEDVCHRSEAGRTV